ncbi:MAG: hypothetical protein GX640_05900 [Fibrobacter sp.]|nr:hypothetical protein [Fibrobacter sp.]
MKKVKVVLLLVGIFYGSAFPLKLGLEFQAGNQSLVGANLRFTERFELKPQLGLLFRENYSQFQLVVNANFYLPDIGKVQHYAGPGMYLGFASGQDGQFGLDGHYGLRYNINDAISLFGQLGLGFNITPSFQLSTFTSGAGITFYILEN